MKVYKKRLPEGVRKQFALEKGIKVKVLNSLYYDKKKKNTTKENSVFYESIFAIKKLQKLEQISIWQGWRESNSHQKFWRLLCYHYTTPLWTY